MTAENAEHIETEQQHAETKQELTAKLEAATKETAVLNVALEEEQKKATQEKATL